MNDWERLEPEETISENSQPWDKAVQDLFNALEEAKRTGGTVVLFVPSKEEWQALRSHFRLIEVGEETD